LFKFLFVALLQVCDLPDTVTASKLAYWQSKALSREFPAYVGSPSQLNVYQLVSCPSLLAATLVSDPAVIVVPLIGPPKRSEVTDWLKQQIYGQPIDSELKAKGDSVADRHTIVTDTFPVDYGQPNDSKHTNKNPESVIATAVSMDSQGCKSLKSEEKDFEGGQQKNSSDNSTCSNTISSVKTKDDDDYETKKQKRPLVRRRQHRVSFLSDVRQNSIGLDFDLKSCELSNFPDQDGDEVDNKRCITLAAADEDDDKIRDWQNLVEGKSPISDSNSIILCSQPSCSSEGLPKASFVELEVPASWKERQQSQRSDIFRHSGSVEGGQSLTSTPQRRPHVASTSTTRAKGHRGNEVVDLSVISCSPVTPRTTSDLAIRTGLCERTCSPAVENNSEDYLTVVPCSPLTPSATSDLPRSEKDKVYQKASVTGIDGGDDDITIVSCTPEIPSAISNLQKSEKSGSYRRENGTGIEDGGHDDITVIPSTPVSQMSVEHLAKDKRPSARSDEDQQDGTEEPEELTTVNFYPPVTPTTTSKPVVQKKPQRVPQVKVIFSVFISQ